jgi:hypothetical protein
MHNLSWVAECFSLTHLDPNNTLYQGHTSSYKKMVTSAAYSLIHGFTTSIFSHIGQVLVNHIACYIFVRGIGNPCGGSQKNVGTLR